MGMTGKPGAPEGHKYRSFGGWLRESGGLKTKRYSIPDNNDLPIVERKTPRVYF